MVDKEMAGRKRFELPKINDPDRLRKNRKGLAFEMGGIPKQRKTIHDSRS